VWLTGFGVGVRGSVRRYELAKVSFVFIVNEQVQLAPVGTVSLHTIALVSAERGDMWRRRMRA
jgi:hypothetical protein